MGWLWSSDSPPAPHPTKHREAEVVEKPQETAKFGLTSEQRNRIFGQFARQQESSGSTRDQKADEELDAFLKSLEAPGFAPPTTQETARDGTPLPAKHERLMPDGSLNIHPMALYPATMSCRQAFDQAFYCQSLGGKFNDLYRFGHLKDCSEQWGAFWFCMRTRTLPSQDKEGMIREYYRARDERRRNENKGNSEDIWELRTKPVERAFWKDPDADDDGHDVQVKE
ncbi:hypothetical protein BAUCODRAFT_34127 [Baudoinia panamericana UAMH 10762]|uniref:Early meiotic induction protein 1 n=1 Tax=Baudoinia panamericana (strain UAMH 10762) TaxID=717646 RepID=M2NCT7_BAUPA|nr:uncharacterized protein BAUCODRAFT_34127 [Baudoinia panamericana UAMH 10762]EMC96735.1 hypothetical protein BAUCODRAFT_34127 [Baudoinia panamericana UAMH 10762]